MNWMLGDVVGSAAVYLLVLPLAAMPVAWITSQIGRQVTGWFVTAVFAVDALLALWLLGEASAGPRTWTLYRLISPAGPIDLEVMLTRDRALAILLLALLGAGVVTATWQTLTSRQALAFYVPALLGTVAAQGAILAAHPLALFCFLAIADLVLALAIALELTVESRQVVLRYLGATQAALLLAGLLWWNGYSPGVPDPWWPLIAGGNGLVLALAAFWATRLGLLPFHTWLTSAIGLSREYRATILVMSSYFVGGFLLVEFSTRAQPEWRNWSSIMLIVGGATVAIGVFRLLGQTTIYRSLLYLTLIQAGTLAIAAAFGSATAELARTLTALTAIGLTLAYVAATTARYEAGVPRSDGGLAIGDVVTFGGLVVGFIIGSGLPPLATFGLRGRLLEHMLTQGASVGPAAWLIAYAALVLGVGAAALVGARLLGEAWSARIAEPERGQASRRLDSTRVALGALLALSFVTSFAVMAPGADARLLAVSLPAITARLLLLVAVIAGIVLVLTETGMLDARTAAGRYLRASLRAVTIASAGAQRAADRGALDPLLFVAAVTVAAGRAVAHTFDFLLGRFTREPGE